MSTYIKDFIVLVYHIKEALLVVNEWLCYNVGFPSVWCEYVLIQSVKKEAILAYGMAERS